MIDDYGLQGFSASGHWRTNNGVVRKETGQHDIIMSWSSNCFQDYCALFWLLPELAICQAFVIYSHEDDLAEEIISRERNLWELITSTFTELSSIEYVASISLTLFIMNNAYADSRFCLKFPPTHC